MLFRVFNGGIKGNRKFVVAMSALLLSAIGLFIGKVTGAEWVTSSGLIVGLFGGANAVVHATGGEKDGQNT